VQIAGPGHRVFNNVIHDTNYAANEASPIAAGFNLPTTNGFLIAWNTIYNEYNPGLQAFLQERLKYEPDGLNLSEALALRVWELLFLHGRKLHEFDPALGDFAVFLNQSAKKEIHNYFRSKLRRRIPIEEEFPNHPIFDPHAVDLDTNLLREEFESMLTPHDKAFFRTFLLGKPAEQDQPKLSASNYRLIKYRILMIFREFMMSK